MRPRGTLLWLRTGGLLIWAAVGWHVLLGPWRAGGQVDGSPGPWMAAFLAFGAAFWLATAGRIEPAPSWRFLGLLAAQSVAALAVLRLAHSGFAAVLLVLVAGQLALLERAASGGAAIALQTAGLAGVLAGAWPLPAAAFVFSSYLIFQLFAFLLCRVIQSEARARLALARANAELRATRRLLAESSRMAERLRISRELHDLLGHHLAALSLQLELASHRAGEAEREPLERSRALAKLLLADVRAAVSDLREEPGFRLEAALAALVEEIPRPRIHLELPAELGIADPGRAQALLRCVQEIVTNAIRHADAENLWIAVSREPDGVEVRARDDGRGTARVAAGHGLRGLARRLEELGGRLDLASGAGQGFRVTARLPLEGAAP